MKVVVCILLSLPLLACFRAEQYITDVGDTLTSETATIYVINPNSSSGGSENNLIYLDEYLIGRIGSNTHIRTTVATGAGKQYSIRTSARPAGKYAFLVEPNTIQYFEFEVTDRENNNTLPLLRKLSEEDGRLLRSRVPDTVAYRPKSAL
ncbi:hypothetical protein [Lewinella sp. IMCC34191]|uniref:hypothetical protein n=1 Tax=Lewinella sp. IMCC34191 TaxID=2259172 RepID=UPI000E245262|nr:hypothetical protein [Lewinella sp. IMCC34191]